VDYLIATPEKRRTERICHDNMLKRYIVRHSDFTDDTMTTIHTQVVESALDSDLCPSYSPSYDASSNVQTFKLDNLPSSEPTKLESVLNEFKSCFDEKPGKTTLISHTISVHPGTRRIKLPPYRVNPTKAEAIKTELDNMLELGVIKPSNSPWAAPVVLIPKPDNIIRSCTDYRRLNAVTVPDVFPMPQIDDLIDKVANAKFLTKIDLAKGYWQVPLDDAAVPIPAFVTSFGQFQWKYMPFGLRNAPGTFESLVNRVLVGLDKYTAAYLDDILIFSNSWSEHIFHIREVLKRIKTRV